MENDHLFEKYKADFDKERKRLDRYDRMCMGAMLVTSIVVIFAGIFYKDIREICVLLAWVSTLAQVAVLRKKLNTFGST